MSNNDNEIVVTSSGKKVPRKNTRLIKEEYHEIGVDCFRIGTSWYRLSTGLLAINLDTKEPFLLKNMDEGKFNTRVILEVLPTGEYLYGFTKEDSSLFIPVITDKGKRYVISNTVLRKMGAKLSRGGYYACTDFNVDKFDKVNKEHLQYSLKDYKINLSSNLEKLKNEVDHYSFLVNLSARFDALKAKAKDSKLKKQFNEALGSISFGVETESSSNCILSLAGVTRQGLICLRDGSIDGLEVVTLPKFGYDGLVSMVSSYSEVEPMFNYDHKCSTHIHVAGKSLSREQILAIYCLCYRIQEEIFEFVHPYKRNIEYLKQIAHEYSEPLKSLSIVYNSDIYQKDGTVDENSLNRCLTTLSRFMTSGGSNKFENVFSGTPKYKILPRYFWVNFVNLLESTNKTIEFRCFTPTFNADMLSFWSFMCMCIYKYGAENYKQILSSGFHIKMDQVFDFLLEGKDKEEQEELWRLVESAKKTFYSVIAHNSNSSIMRAVTFNGYKKSVQECSKFYKSFGQIIRKDILENDDLPNIYDKFKR